MQQYFVKGLASSPVAIEDKETSKHMFQVMRLKEDDEVTLVFDDGIKRLARVVNVEVRQLELIEELADNVELPVQVTIASGFPKGDKLEFITQKVTELGASQFHISFEISFITTSTLTKNIQILSCFCTISQTFFRFSRNQIHFSHTHNKHVTSFALQITSIKTSLEIKIKLIQ